MTTLCSVLNATEITFQSALSTQSECAPWAFSRVYARAHERPHVCYVFAHLLARACPRTIFPRETKKARCAHAFLLSFF